MHFPWKKEYEMDIKIIDDQHRHFVDLINELYESILEEQLEEKLGSIFDGLIEHATNHFSTEEKYFDLFQYEGSEEHKQKHREIKDKILMFKSQFKENKMKLSFELIDFLEDWLVDHLSNLDRKYVPCFHEHGLK